MILHVVGSAEDPDKVDYYTHTRGFPIAYTPDDDPEVVDETKIAAIELNDGKNDVSEDESTAGESNDEQCVDEDKDDQDKGHVVSILSGLFIEALVRGQDRPAE